MSFSINGKRMTGGSISSKLLGLPVESEETKRERYLKMVAMWCRGLTDEEWQQVKEMRDGQ